MERSQLKKIKKRCAIPEKKLKELESILHQAIEEEEEEDDDRETERRSLPCEEIDQRSFFLNSLLLAEIASCASPPGEEGHLMNIQRCFDALHHAYHEWTDNSDPTLLQQYYLGSHRPQPECTASCFNTDDDDEEEEEDEDIGELTSESIVSMQMSENPMELECCDHVEAPVVPAPEMVSVGVQTDTLLPDDEEEEEENKIKSTNCFKEVTEKDLLSVSEELYEDEAEETEAEEEAAVVRPSAAVAKGVGWMGCGMMMMGFMLGRFYHAFFNNSFDYYYYCYSRVVGGGGLLHPT